MEPIKYEVVFMGDHSDGLRHPVKVVTTATNATIALGIAEDVLEDDRIQSTNHELISVAPYSISQPVESDDIAIQQQSHQQALQWLADAYLFYLVSMHRRPMFRHQLGNISLSQHAVQGFIDTHLEEKGLGLKERRARYINLLDMDAFANRTNSDFVDWGTVPVLKPRGIRWLNACFSRYAEMVEELGGQDKVEAIIRGARP